VDVLDAEHESCEAALRSFAQTRDAASLRAVLREFESHFAHEEAMLDQHLYGHLTAGGGAAAASGFSVAASTRASHWQDHKRMLDELRAELARASASSEPISHRFVDSVLRSFEKHAELYDGNYADDLSTKLLLGNEVPVAVG
jgi:hemerythrin